MLALPQEPKGVLHPDLGDSKLYFSTAIEPQMNVATTEVRDDFSTSGCRHGTCAFVNPSQRREWKIPTFMLPRLGQFRYLLVCEAGEPRVK